MSPYKLPFDQIQWYHDWKQTDKGLAWNKRKIRAIERTRVIKRAKRGTLSKKEKNIFISAGIKFHKEI